MQLKLVLLSRIFLCSFLMITNSFAAMTSHQQQLINALNEIRLAKNIPGFSFVLVNNKGTVFDFSSGIENRISNKKMTVDSIIRIGSITKSFTALALLKLEEHNKLSLNDNVKKYSDDLPLKNRWHKTNPVKIVHLLEQTSGLLDLSQAEFSFNDAAVKSLKQAFSFAPQNRVTQWPAGLHASYSNAGAGYLGYIIEKLSGTGYENFVTLTLLKPLKMHQSSFFLDTKTRQNLASGYDSDGQTVIPYWHMIFRPFGALNSSTREMAAFVQLFLNDGKTNGVQLISKKNIRRTELPTTTLAAKAGLQFGYGLANYAHLHNGFVFFGHGGDGDGYLAHFGYNRATGLGYFIVLNAFNQTAIHKMRMLLEDFIITHASATVVTKIQVPAIYPHTDLKQFVGSYEQVTYRMPWLSKLKSRINIRVSNDKLYYQTENNSQQLIPLNEYHFRLKYETVATQAFIFFSGELYFQNTEGNYKRIKHSTLK